MTIDKASNTASAVPVITAPVVLLRPKAKDPTALLPPADFVYITSAARVRSMKQEGQSVAQIAVAMGLKTDAIWAFLQLPPLASSAYPTSEVP